VEGCNAASDPSSEECARNGFGAKFCGQELKEYRERIQQGEREGQALEKKVERDTKEAERQLETGE
jgi:hypothetical protein